MSRTSKAAAPSSRRSLERLLQAEEVAEYLGIPVSTLYRWRHKGCGPEAYRVGSTSATPRTPTITRKHLTIADLCEELGIARSTFYDWRAKGRAPRCIKLPNGNLRIRRTEFERWLAEHEDESA